MLVLLFLGAGLPKMYAGSVLLSRRINLNVQKKSIETVLHLVEKKTNIQFMYNPQMFNLKRLVSVSLQNSTLQEVLQVVINNKELVFYEMGKYIVITNKRQAPIQTDVVSAYLPIISNQIKEENNRQLIVDTIHFYDTIKITKTKTERLVIYDTIRIYDTITKMVRPVVSQSEIISVDKPSNSKWFAQIAFGPSCADLLPQTKWIADLSLSAQGVVGYKRNNVNVSIGLGGFWQHGASKSYQASISSDSILQRDTIFVMQKYRTGNYYYIVGTDTIYKEIFDSTMTAVPRQWYKTIQHEKNTETLVSYSIYWIIIPCKIEYEWTLSKRMTLGLGISVSPAFAIRKYGELYVPELQKTASIVQSGIRSFALFGSIESSFSYAVSKTVSIQCIPIVQFSVRSLMNESAYYFGSGVRFGIRKYF